MGQPAYELRELQRKGLVLLSSNYPLYQDISRRMSQAISEKVVDQSPYSIDESFVLLTGMQGSFDEIGKEIQQHVLKKVGIPTGVGISRNRTTAKLANWASKKWKRSTGSVVAVMEYDRLRKMLAYAPVNDVWGVGSKLSEHLGGYGITTALELADADSTFLRHKHGVTLERTQRELNWHYCLGYEDHAEPKKTLSCTRTFTKPITNRDDLAKSIKTFVANLGRKLRKDGLLSVAIKVFIQPARGCLMTPAGKSATISHILPTNDTRVLVSAAAEALAECYVEGGRWVRSGVIVLQAIEERHFVPDLFASSLSERSSELMRTIDRINNLEGMGTIRFAGEHRTLAATLERKYPSHRFTTSWKELPEAY
tara:strand:- start:2679 stop:3782 length:1104 start_codon:yes stop_codon:yes gene_type:complete